jgi:hypothetical protein
MKVGTTQPEKKAPQKTALFKELIEETLDGLEQRESGRQSAPSNCTRQARADTLKPQVVSVTYQKKSSPRAHGQASAISPKQSFVSPKVAESSQAEANAELSRLRFERTLHFGLVEDADASRTEQSERLVLNVERRIVEILESDPRYVSLDSLDQHEPGVPAGEAAAALELPFRAPELPTVSNVSSDLRPLSSRAKATREVRGAEAVALIQKIEAFVKSNRPTLAVTLNNTLGVRAEIERIGPKSVALTLVGSDGPPPVDVLTRIRREIRGRGLTIASLSLVDAT